MIWGSAREEGGCGEADALQGRSHWGSHFPRPTSKEAGRVGDRCLSEVRNGIQEGSQMGLACDKCKVKSQGGGQPVYPGPG